MIRMFNEVSKWVSTCIVTCDRIRIRARVMVKFIKIAEVLIPSYEAKHYSVSPSF